MLHLQRWSLLVVAIAVFIMPNLGCGGSSTAPDEETPTYTVGVTVTGLDGTLVLQNNGGDDLTISADGAFAFATSLEDAAAYDVTILSKSSLQNCAVANGSGAIDGADVTDVAVDCSNKAWSVPASASDHINPDDATATDVDMLDAAMNGSTGNAVVVWNQGGMGPDWWILTSNYRDGAWDNPTAADDDISPAGDYAGYARVAVNEQGDTLIVWEQQIGGEWRVFKSEYRDGAWTHPADGDDCISPKGTHADYPRVAIDDDGNAIVVWEQYDGGTNRIMMSEYRNGAWTHPASTDDAISVAGEETGEANVAMDDNGNAIVIWLQEDGGGDDVLVKSEYRDGTWTHPSDLSDRVSPAGSYVVDRGELAMGYNGDAIIAWYQGNSSGNDQVFVSEYRGGAWTRPSGIDDNISPDGQDAQVPRVAMDANGNAIVVWSQDDGAAVNPAKQIYKSEYRGGAWTHPTLADAISNPGTDAEEPDVAMDPNGSAIIAWHQEDATPEQMVYKSEYRKGAWTHPAGPGNHVSPSGTNTTYYPMTVRVAMDPNGDALIAWLQYDGAHNMVYVAEFR